MLSLVLRRPRPRPSPRWRWPGCRDDGSKDLEILVLCHEIRVLRSTGPPKLRTVDRVLLAAASRAIPRDRWATFIATPATFLRWHRQLVKRKWTYGRTGRPGRPGRPSIGPEVHVLILRLAERTPAGAACGSAASSASSGSEWERRRSGACSGGRDSVPPRGGPVVRAEFLRAQADGIIACGFFTVETAWLRTLHVLLFIKLGSRRIHLSGSTVHPDSGWSPNWYWVSASAEKVLSDGLRRVLARDQPGRAESPATT